MSTIKRPTEQPVEFHEGYIINPDAYYAPTYRISPLTTADISRNFSYSDSSAFFDYFSSRYPDRKWQFTHTGKEAISLAVQALKVKRDDCITLYTTTQNHYVSGCVTKEIEKYCDWSREIRPNTVAMFVNHEFGFPYRDMTEIKALGFPIIEDACHSFLADSPNRDMGNLGDFILFSLPKVFPMQMGGVLCYSKKFLVPDTIPTKGPLAKYLNRVTSHFVPELKSATQKRRENFNYLSASFEKLNCRPRFEMLSNDVPGVFMFIPPKNVDLQRMKEFGWRHGIECSIFYGEHAFFIPCHQNLSHLDLDYFVAVFQYFFETESQS